MAHAGGIKNTKVVLCMKYTRFFLPPETFSGYAPGPYIRYSCFKLFKNLSLNYLFFRSDDTISLIDTDTETLSNMSTSTSNEIHTIKEYFPQRTSVDLDYPDKRAAINEREESVELVGPAECSSSSSSLDLDTGLPKKKVKNCTY